MELPIRPKLNTQLDAVLYYMQIMDIDMLGTLLDRQAQYQDMDKDIFLSRLDVVFQTFKDQGAVYLTKHKGKCTGCSPFGIGYLFKGNVGQRHIAFIFVIDQEKNISDFYECSEFTKGQELDLDNRIVLDNDKDLGN